MDPIHAAAKSAPRVAAKCTAGLRRRWSDMAEDKDHAVDDREDRSEHKASKRLALEEVQLASGKTWGRGM